MTTLMYIIKNPPKELFGEDNQCKYMIVKNPYKGIDPDTLTPKIEFEESIKDYQTKEWFTFSKDIILNLWWINIFVFWKHLKSRTC